MFINFILLFVYIYMLSASASLSWADSQNKDNINQIAVVVNINNPVKALTSREISDLYLVRRRTFPSGEPVVVLEHQPNSSIRENFYKFINGMTLKRLNAYWARLQFSGDVQPPPVMNDNEAMLKTVRQNRYAVGYIESEYVDDSVNVILIVE